MVDSAYTDRRRREWLSYNEDPKAFKAAEGNRKYNAFTTIKTEMTSCNTENALIARTFLDRYFQKAYSLYHLIILNRMVKFEYWERVVNSAPIDDLIGESRFNDYVKSMIEADISLTNPSYRPRKTTATPTVTLTNDSRDLVDHTLKTFQDRLNAMIAEIDTLRQLIAEDSDESA